MPTTYPAQPAASVDVNNVETINRFLASPTMVQRRLRTLAENRFIADVLLKGRIPSSGGSVLFEQSESIFATRLPEAVEPGASYPGTPVGEGAALMAGVKNWGLQTTVTDVAIRRLLMNPVERGMTKLVNSVVRQVDSVALTAISAAITQTIAVATPWATSTKILRDVLTGRATIVALNQGYDPTFCVVDDFIYAILMSDPVIAAGLRREDPTNPIYTGRFPVVGGVTFLPTPNIPVASTALLVDADQLGAMVDELPLAARSIREEDGPSVVEGWVLRAGRIVVPIVQEPASGIKFTGI
jgi:hypothetical protein